VHTPHPEQYLALRKYGRAFEQVAGMGWMGDFYGSDGSTWQNLPGLVISSNWLPTLGVLPILGRNFVDEEETAGRDIVVILSYGCWRTRFHADRRVIGRQIYVNRREVLAPLVLETYTQAGNLRSGSAKCNRRQSPTI
jgi:hypothetical protein